MGSQLANKVNKRIFLLKSCQNMSKLFFKGT